MHSYINAFKPILRQKALVFQSSHHYTNEFMARLFRITPRAYNELKSGKYCLSSSSLIFLLFQMDNDQILDFIQELRAYIEEFESKDDSDL